MDIIQDLAVPGVGRLSVAAVRRHVGAPWSTVKREMDALVLLHVLQVDEEKAGEGGEKTNWLYSLHPNFDRVTVAGMTLPPGANAGGSKQGEFSWGASPKK